MKLRWIFQREIKETIYSIISAILAIISGVLFLRLIKYMAYSLVIKLILRILIGFAVGFESFIFLFDILVIFFFVLEKLGNSTNKKG